MRPHVRIPIALVLLAVLAASPAAAQTLRATVRAVNPEAQRYEPSSTEYPFTHTSPVARFDQVFSTPRGFARVDAPAGSYGAWLRGLPVRLDRQNVLSFKGAALNSPSAAIIALDVGEKNLQQCADSAIRLHAEFLWARGRSAELAYHFTSGDEVRFTDWVAGERLSIDGAKVRRRAGAPRSADHASMRQWLDVVFMYAGTRSLHRDSHAVQPADVRAGDFYVAPGSPGHAVVVLDVATARDGRRVALLGQGYMPAQDFHVLRGTAPQALDGAWFVLPSKLTDIIDTPSWQPFRGSDLRRFVR